LCCLLGIAALSCGTPDDAAPTEQPLAEDALSGAPTVAAGASGSASSSPTLVPDTLSTATTAEDATAVDLGTPTSIDDQPADEPTPDLTATAASIPTPPTYYPPPMPTIGVTQAPSDSGVTVTPDVSGMWGTFGTGGGSELNSPHGIAVDTQGRVLVADTNNGRVAVFDPSGIYLGDLGGGHGDGDGQFRAPLDVCVDGAGNIYVADQALRRISKFDADGAFLLSWSGPQDGDPTPTVPAVAPPLYGPWALACPGTDDVFVVDAGWTVLRYCQSGEFLAAWEPAQRIAPITAVAVLPDGRVLVGDQTQARIEAFDGDGNDLGTFFDSDAAGASAFIPWNLATDQQGNVYVGDIRNQRVLKLDSQGALLAEVRLPDIGRPEDYIYGLTVDINGAMYVVASNGGYDGVTGSYVPSDRPDRVDHVLVLAPWP